MRGKDERQLVVFSYLNPEQRVPQNHPLRPLRSMNDQWVHPKCFPKSHNRGAGREFMAHHPFFHTLLDVRNSE
jgi:hypothetical protein